MLLDFCPLVIELLKYQSHLQNQNILIEPAWHFEGPQTDTIILTDRNKKYQLRFSRERWDLYREFQITRQMGPEGYNYRVDLITNEPIQIFKTIITHFWSATAVPPFEIQDFAKEAFRIIVNLSDSYIRARNQYNHEQITHST